MLLEFIGFISIAFILYSLSKIWKRYHIYLIIKGSLQLGLLILFIGLYIKLFQTIPSNLYIKVIYTIIYLWSTIGINVNLMIPLIKLIESKKE